MRHNWRTGKSIRNSTAPDFDKVYLAAYSYLNENLPIAYVSEVSQCMLAVNYTGFTYTDTVFLYSDRFPYTKDTYNRPQKVWTFVSVSPFITSSNILLIEVSAKRHFLATTRPRVPFFGLLTIKNYGQLKSAGLRYLLYARLALGMIRVRHRNNLFSYIEDEYNRSEDAMRIIMKKTRRRPERTGENRTQYRLD